MNYAIRHLVLMSPLLPYAMHSPPVRFHNILIYVLFLFALYGAKLTRDKRVIYALLSYLAVICIGMMVSLIYINHLNFYRIIGSLERMMFVLPVIFVVSYLKLYQREYIEILFRYYAFFFLFNFFLQALQVMRIDILWLQDFWILDYRSSVAFKAGQNLRYMGLFNQPLEYGVFASIILMYNSICGVFLNRMRNYLLTISIVIGGIFSMSKVILVLGFSLALLGYFTSKRVRYNSFAFFAVVLSVLVAFYLVYAYTLADNAHFDNIVAIARSGNVIEFLSGGRFGGPNDDVQELFVKSFSIIGFLGYGFGSTMLLDNGYIEYLYQTGLLGFVFFLIYFSVIFRAVFFRNAGDFMVYSKFMYVFIALTMIGAPVLTMWFISLPFVMILLNSCCIDKRI